MYKLISHLTTTPPLLANANACFIERGWRVRPFAKMLINYWLHALRPPSFRRQLLYEDYIVKEVLHASQNEDGVWQVVKEMDHIWCETHFIGEGAELFSKMLRLAKDHHLSHKYVFDLAERGDAMHHLGLYDPTASKIMHELEQDNRISFFFWEEIASMMGSTSASPPLAVPHY